MLRENDAGVLISQVPLRMALDISSDPKAFSGRGKISYELEDLNSRLEFSLHINGHRVNDARSTRNENANKRHCNHQNFHTYWL